MKKMMCYLLSWTMFYCTLIGLDKGRIAMKLTSRNFTHGNPIPKKYTCEGDNISPTLEWSDVPQGTKSFTLLCEDPDAPIQNPPWVHWILFNISPTTTHLPEKIALSSLPGASMGTTNANTQKYEGPCPPPGHGVHHYHFKLYALDTTLDLPQGASYNQVKKALQGHALAQTQLTGTYERK